MALLVLKFGGTSVGSLECINRVADIVYKTKQQGHDVVVVVSAMSGETDRLIGLANNLHHDPDPREYAVLVSSGEQVSMSLLSIALISRGIKAKSFTGAQARIITDDKHKKARIKKIDAEHMLEDLHEGRVVVVAGFQGITEQGEITTLGRGGSDTSAVALAVGLNADECRIYTDVEGVFTADPRIVPSARCMERITFEEMLEMSSLGAKVLQIRAVEFAGKYNVPLRVLSTFKEGPGTLITYEEKGMESPVVSGVTYNRGEAKITVVGVPDTPGTASKILNAVSEQGIEIDMIIQNIGEQGRTDFTFTLSRDDFPIVMNMLEELLGQLKAEKVIGDTKIAKLSIVGVGMRSHAGIASSMFNALAKEGINIQMISTSEIKVSVIIDEKYLELGARALHSAFGLDTAPAEEIYPNQE